MLLLATYASSHAALRAEGRLREAGLEVELIPVPRSIRSDCGFCLLAEVGGAEDRLRATHPAGLWRALDPLPGSARRRYEPYP